MMKQRLQIFLKTARILIGKKVGILGSGQLAWMLSESARRLGLSPQCCENVTEADSLNSFFKSVELVAYENDFLDFGQLETFKRQGVVFLPELSVLKTVSNKINQKKLWSRLKIPAPKYWVYEYLPLKPWLEKIFKESNKGLVLKAAGGGYDGKGVFVADKIDKALLSFCEKFIQRKETFFAEEKIVFKRELALVAVRSLQGEFLNYPLVISEQKEGICRQVLGPAVKLGVSKDLEKKAVQYAKTVAQSLPLVGTFALELFEDKNGELLINELAPRVHNSGHFSLTACSTSQFENHWRALLSIPLGATQTTGFFVMRNLLGPESGSKFIKNFDERNLWHPNIHMFWYGKKEWRAKRKLGHFNAVVPGKKRLFALIKELDTLEKNWQQYLAHSSRRCL